MPQFTWIGKNKVENHDKELPFKVLKPNKKLSHRKGDNLLIEGDNLEALKALMPFYHNKVKCIYIDPPYNTGNEKWVYNDKVNSPQIKQWLKKVVGPEGEDLCRHDKWLCMMYPRLKLLKDLLSEDGFIFVSIDDNELCNLKLILDEIFGENNFVTNFIWKKKGTSTNVKGAFISSLAEYVVCYKKSPEAKLKQRVVSKEKRRYPFHDSEGDYRLTIIEKKDVGDYERPTMKFLIIGKKPRTGKRWQIGEETARELEKKKRFIIQSGVIKLKIYDFEDKDTVSAQPNILEDCGSTQSAQHDLDLILDKKVFFDNPKPKELIKKLLGFIKDNNCIVLDSFAGSGTTGQAVLELNKEDIGNRKFILVELEKKIAQEVTAVRLKKVINGYKGAKYPNGTGQGFKYLELNGELFNSSGQINKSATYEDLASYIYFTETNNYLDLEIIKNPYIGSFGTKHFFLLFNGQGKNTLSEKSLQKIKGYKGELVIYADKCLLDEEYLLKHNIVFRQIPYELKKY